MSLFIRENEKVQHPARPLARTNLSGIQFLTFNMLQSMIPKDHKNITTLNEVRGNFLRAVTRYLTPAVEDVEFSSQHIKRVFAV
jgi:hypothetical protein